jgi:phosphotransferase system enzyme I (PtsI)
MAGAPVKIRTCDVGGDTVLPNFLPQNEKNPLLGWRAIRFSLAMPELFKEQLRAILRAAVGREAEITLPLISNVDEVNATRSLIGEAARECRAAGQAITERVRLGVMVEVPSAAVTADILARNCDYFSIGTNDLVQYSLAVDRGNEKVAALAEMGNPAIIRLLAMIIDAAHNERKKVSMCGEMAGVPLYTPLLLGLGLDEFSMTASRIPAVKRIIRACALSDCQALASDVRKCETGSAVRGVMEEFNRGLALTR